MSCETNGNRAALAGTAAGLAKTGSKLSNVTGALLSRARQASDSGLAGRIDRTIDYGGRLMAPAAALATGTFRVAGAAETKKLAGVAGGAAVGYMVLKNKPSGMRRAVGDLAVGGVRTAANAIPYLGTALKTIKKIERATSLTGLINRQDVIGTSRFSGKQIAASEGVMFRSGGKTWHRGTTVVNLPGGPRTITHLQGLSLPSTHYYFDRPISAENAVGIAAEKIEPERVPGYVGRVSATESLCPGWAQAKHALLRTRLHWPLEDG